MLITGVTKRKLRNLGYENTFGHETSLPQTIKQDWSEIAFAVLRRPIRVL